jgi:shikimate dehydrogenase
MRIFGIIGRPLGHSLSKVYFEEKFVALSLEDCRFEKFQLDNIHALDTVLEEDGLKGFCVTIPYKKEIMARLDEISVEARAIGAVNCVRVAGGRLSGYNTDAHGFRVGLERLLGDQLLWDNAKPRALILGTGGASCAVRYILEQASIDYRMVSRAGGDGLLTYEELTPEIIDAHRLIVNTTPLGTSPNIEEKPQIPYDAIGSGHYLYDLVYNPPVTAFLAEGQRRGAATINGEVMFRAQAEKNWAIWTTSLTS